jgi:alpha-L-rhamnosidase
MLKGNFIGVKENVGVFVVEKRFTAHAGERAVLKVTALGLYFAEINGVRVGDAYLTPGWTSYNKMLQVQEYDVTALLKEGENVLSLTVGEGWYCGPLTWERKRSFYGKQSAVCADLIFADRTVSTDESWTARESVIRASGIYDGETQDFTAECKPLTVCEVAFDKSVLVPQISEPVRNVERLPVKEVIHTPAGELVYDFGQNMAGVVEIRTPENFNGTLTLQFAEILVNGNFYTDNLRSAKATDTFTVKGARTLSPEFTFHGFRYMKLTGAELPQENVTAIVRYTDMKRTGHIHTSNDRFNRLMDNVIWGQKGNFVDIPTDCPQRDERLGWTGDINAFCTTAAYNYDIRAFMKKWLADLRNDQGEGGEIPHVCPDVLEEKHTDAMWCDAITMVPWNLYQTYGDVSFLADNYAAMKKFISARERTMTDGLVSKGHEFGDWLALDQEKTSNETFIGRTDSYYIVNILHVHSLKIVAETAKLLGEKLDEGIYQEKYETHLKRVREEYFTVGGRLCLDTVTAQVLALNFNIVPEAHRASLAKTLNENVIKHGYRMVTGFIGSPYLLFALADNGNFETARRVLLNNGYPSWLYEVDMGATTVWERWNSLMPDGTPNPDGMNSYNHYAYGSVMEFVYRRIAGIEPLEAGFKKIRIAPNPCKGLAAFKSEYDSVNGKIISNYEQKDGKITYTVEIPDGVKAEIVLPNEQPIKATGRYFEFEREWEDLDSEPFTPESYVTEVFDNPKAVKAFNEVFGGIFTGSEIAWMKNEPKTLGFMAWFRDGEKKMNLSDFPAMLKRANELFYSKIMK